MALIVENGTGMSTAESYVSVADAATYHTAFTEGTVWADAATPAKERALRVATQYIDNRYGPRFQGNRVQQTQTLAWPRINVEDNDGFYVAADAVPTKVRHATCELALRALAGPLQSDAKSGNIMRELKELGPLKKEIEYSGGGQETQTTYTVVDELLQPLLRPLEIERS